jgi:hypothetical protein
LVREARAVKPIKDRIASGTQMIPRAILVDTIKPQITAMSTDNPHNHHKNFLERNLSIKKPQRFPSSIAGKKLTTKINVAFSADCEWIKIYADNANEKK